MYTISSDDVLRVGNLFVLMQSANGSVHCKRSGRYSLSSAVAVAGYGKNIGDFLYLAMAAAVQGI